MTGSDGHRSRARAAWRWAWLQRTDVEGALRGREEQPDRLLADVAADARHRPDLADEFGRRRRVMGQLVDRRLRHVGHRRRGAGVTLRTDELRQRLIGDLTHDVAAEVPLLAGPSSVTSSRPSSTSTSRSAGSKICPISDAKS